MNDKVKLPKCLYDALQDYGLPEDGNESWPVFTISDLCNYWKEIKSNVLGTFIDRNADNQWKLIDALRYGYEPEPEPRWAIKAGHSYLYEPNDKSFGPDEEPFAYDLRERAEEVVARLGFGEVVDLNKEGKADD